MVEKPKTGSGMAGKSMHEKIQAKPRPKWRQGAKRDTFPWINSQLIAVAETGQLPDLLSTIEAYLPQMNLVNISTAFHRLSKLLTSMPEDQVNVRVRPVSEGLVEAAKASLAKAAASGTGPSAQALCNIMWAVATLSIVDEHLLQAISGPSVSQVAAFKPFELSTILWSYAKLSTVDAKACACAKTLFDVSSAFMVGKTEEFTFRCLVTTVWAYATFRQPSAALFKAIGNQMVAMVHTANCQELGNTAWAFGMASIPHEKLFQELLKRASLRLHEFKAQELASILWGFAANRFFQGAFFANASLTAQRLDMGPRQLTNILWALTRKKLRQNPMQGAVSALVTSCTRQIEQFTLSEIAVVAFAAAKATSFGEEKGNAVDSFASDFCVAAMSVALDRLKDLGNQALVNLATAFLVIRAPGAVVMLAAVGREALDRLQILETSVLLHLIRIFSVDLTSLQPPPLLEGACQGMSRALFAEAARRMDLLKPREMQQLSKLCSEPLGMPQTDDLSAGDLRGCCFALATSSQALQMPFALLDDVLEDDSDIFWAVDPVVSTKLYTTDSATAPTPSNLFACSVPGIVHPTLLGTMWPTATRAGHGPRPMLPAQFIASSQGNVAWAMSGMMGMPVPYGFSTGYPTPQVPITPTAVTPPPASPRGVDQRSQQGTSERSSPSQVPNPKLVCSVKNTFLHVDCSDSEEEIGDEALSEANLGPPLQFLPKDIQLSELQAFRADYMKFRAGQATGARGEISDVCEVPRNYSIDALGLVESSEGQIRRMAEHDFSRLCGPTPVPA
jgi:hypothetical protein